MATDLALLDEIAAGAAPALRLYHWDPPALSLGRFQPLEDIDARACARHGVEIVRRPTGGRALLHGGDLTYAVAVPRPRGADGSIEAIYHWLARGLVAGLASLGVDAATGRGGRAAGPACFSAQQGADLRVGERKLCGSAQVHRNGTVLQHGSVRCRPLEFDETALLRYTSETARATAAGALARSAVTLDELGAASDLPTVAGAVVAGFEDALGVEFTPSRARVTPPT
jgi:lipoate-protein ligase A